MFVFELTNSEAHPAYQQLQVDNLSRQYGFLQSIVTASLELRMPLLSIEVIKALNYHAISCLHVSAGEFRPCEVRVGTITPPMFFQVPPLMQMFTNEVNRNWETSDPVGLAAYALWRLNYIHPFVNGNGRTARVVAYLLICLKAGGWLPGTTLLPERIVAVRDEYVDALREADASLPNLNLGRLHALISRLLDDQLAEAGIT